MNDLRVKYRPKTLEEVVGQPNAVRAIKSAMKRGSGNSFLLTGPAGVGKTTLARIAAASFGCTQENLREIDAATYTGIDAWKEIRANLKFSPIGASKVRAVIVDEAHALSQQAWNSLLKDVEEPGKQVYWFILTTAKHKVPKTIVTRCVGLELKAVGRDDLMDLMQRICKEEGGGPPEKILGLIADNSDGSPRQALSHLMGLWDTKKLTNAEKFLQSSLDSADAVALCRLLMKGASFKQLMDVVKQLEGQNPEGIRMVVVAYMTKVALGGKTSVLPILEAFSKPYPGDGSIAHVILSIANIQE